MDVLDPRHDGDGLAGACQPVDDRGLVQGLLWSLDKLGLVVAQDAEALDNLVVENSCTVTSHKVQNFGEDGLVNSQRGFIDNALDPLGKVVPKELVLEDVETWRLRISSCLSSWLLASFWFLIGQGCRRFLTISDPR